MSHEEEVITTGPFDETDEHDYSDHHHHHQQEQEQEQEGGNGWMDNNNDNGKDQQNDNGHQQKQEQEEATRRNLYVSNLSFETTEEILRERFSPFGEIVHIEIVRDPVSKVSRGFGFITFALNEQGESAVNTLNGSDINGRPLRVEHARRSVGHVKTPGRYLGPKGGSARFNDRSDRRGGDRGGDRRYDDYNSGPRGGRRSNSRDRDRRPSYRGRSRSRERAPYDRGWGGDNRYPDRGPPPNDRWGGGARSRSRDRGGPPRGSYGGYDTRRDRR